MGQLNLGVKKALNNDKGTFTLAFTDILHTMIWKSEVTLPDGRATSKWHYDMNIRSINLSYTRSFGNKKLKAINIRSGSEAERKRVN